MNEPAKKPSATAKRNSARLMAVQAVYQMTVNRKEAPFVVAEYMSIRAGIPVDGDELVAPDESLFKSIVLGVAERAGDLKGIVEANRPLKEGQIRVDEPLLEAVLLCGTFELLVHQDVDSPIIISSYVDVAKAFYGGSEPSLINAILDAIRKVIRA